MFYHLLITSVSLLIIVCLYYYIVNKKKKAKWLDYPIIFLPTVLSVIVIICNLTISNHNLLDVRYVDKIVKEIRKYESCNIDKNKINYKDEYTLIFSSNNGTDEEREIGKDTYDYFSKKWIQKPAIYVDSTGRKVTIYKWNSKKHGGDILTYTTTELFTNFSNNMFTSNVSKYDIKNYNLFEYHYEINKVSFDGLSEPGQSILYGINITDSVERISNYLSSLDSNFRPLILCWYGDRNKIETIKKQQLYWKGGKDNEIVFCICLNNKKDNIISWSGSFSWADNKKFENYVLNKYLIPGTKFDIYNLFTGIYDGYRKGLWNPSNNYYNITKDIFEESIIIILSAAIIIILNIFSSIRLLKRK